MKKKSESAPTTCSRRGGSDGKRPSGAKQLAVPAAEGCPSCLGKGSLTYAFWGRYITLDCWYCQGTRGGNDKLTPPEA